MKINDIVYWNKDKGIVVGVNPLYVMFDFGTYHFSHEYILKKESQMFKVNDIVDWNGVEGKVVKIESMSLYICV